MRSRETRTTRNKEMHEAEDRANVKKPRRKLKLTSRQKKILAVVLVVVIFLLVVYGRPIIKLRIENRNLQKQNEQLEKERSAKTKELKDVHSKEYIQEQARKQLRLLNKDEKLFIFDDGEGDED